jgi:hypothetical protein
MLAATQAARKEWMDRTKEAALKVYTPIVEARAAELLSNPEKVLPELAAQMFVDLQEAAMANVAAMLPQAISNFQQQVQMKSRGEAEAAAAWPELFPKDNPTEYQRRYQVFHEHAWNFRKMAPQASAKDIIEKAGAAAMIQLGLERAPRGAPVAVSPQAPATPATVPFKPGATGSRGGGLAPTPGKSDNVFVNLAEEFLKDDQS